MLPADVESWRASGRNVDTPAGSVFVRSVAGEGVPVLFLHGYPSSSFDWRHVIGLLPGQSSLSLDFLGFGLSAKPHRHRYSLFEQADIVTQVLADERIDRVRIVAHDMGTSVATELMARDLDRALPFGVDDVVLGNGSVIVERATLRPIQKLLRSPLGPVASRLSSERMFRREFAALFSADHPLQAAEARAQWALIARDGGNRIMHELISYIGERIEFAPRWHGAVRDWSGRVSFLWATADIVATTNVLAGLRELRPKARVHELAGLGHYPQIEDAAAYTAALVELLA
jgi:pimeloyl-ACP methyl ester carboxylesterase